MGAWYSGRWWPEGVNVYLDRVAQYRAAKVWLQPNFVGK